MNILGCAYTNLDGIAYCTPGLGGINMHKVEPMAPRAAVNKTAQDENKQKRK